MFSKAQVVSLFFSVSLGVTLRTSTRKEFLTVWDGLSLLEEQPQGHFGSSQSKEKQQFHCLIRQGKRTTWLQSWAFWRASHCQMVKTMSVCGSRFLREILVKINHFGVCWYAWQVRCTKRNTKVVWIEPKTESYKMFLYPTCQQVPACPQNRAGFGYVLARCLDRNGW